MIDVKRVATELEGRGEAERRPATGSFADFVDELPTRSRSIIRSWQSKIRS